MTDHRAPSFAEFDVRARSQSSLNVVFMGGSLTWGANTTDPQLYSYRALITENLQTLYPHTPFRFWDAAIGGQGSQLAVFRLDRDVLSRHPDLFFLEYAVNDDPSASDEERLASFESLVRRVVTQAKCPVLISILPIRDDVADNPPSRPRHQAHQRIAEAYGCGLAIIAPYIRQQIAAGKISLDKIWSTALPPVSEDHVHPGNVGQALYAEVIWKTFLDSVAHGTTCSAPDQTLHSPHYLEYRRFLFSQIASLPKGWRIEPPTRVAGAYDFLMSRWLDDLAFSHTDISSQPEPLNLQIRGEVAFIFGEATPTSGKYRVTIDGAPASGSPKDTPGVFNAATQIVGNMPHFSTLAVGLDPSRVHTLSIEPLLSSGQELRFESLCLAGKNAWVGLS